MTPLKNPKRENFAQLTVHGAAQGLSQVQMYRLAGYKAEGHAAEVAASRLSNVEEIKRRVAEIGLPAVKKAQVTAESLIADFDAVIAGATRKDQWSAVNRAIELRAKLKGFLADRLEIGAPGEFADMQSPGQVLDALCLDIEPGELAELLRSMADEAEARAATMASPVETKVKRSGQADHALSIFKPGERY